MDINLLARRAIDIIKERYGLPLHGLLAGGSIANLIWEFVSNNKAVINDVDIFLFDGISDEIKKDESIFSFSKKYNEFYEGEYCDLQYNRNTKNFYYITASVKDGIFNNIYYKSKTESKSIIIESFDINATKISYDIDKDEVYWTPDFEEFLKTGKLKVVNLMTPNHTAIRIAKKSIELNAIVDEFEYKILQYTSLYNLGDRIKTRFQERYHNMYEQYSYLLGKYFDIFIDEELEFYLKNINVETKLYYLVSKDANPFSLSSETKDWEFGVFSVDPHFRNITDSDSFLFYIRKIFGNKKHEEIWSKLYFYLNDVNYLDIDIDSNIEDIKLLSNILSNAPNTIEKLRGYKLSEQISIIKNILKSFKDDPNIAIALLEKIRINKDMDFSDSKNLLILELLVRKESKINNKKVDKILSEIKR